MLGIFHSYAVSIICRIPTGLAERKFLSLMRSLLTVITITISQIFIYIYRKLSELHQRLEEEEDNIDLAQITNIWLAWTDPRQVQ